MCYELDFVAVTFICDHPDIRAISFVGSDRAVSVTSIVFLTGFLAALLLAASGPYTQCPIKTSPFLFLE